MQFELEQISTEKPLIKKLICRDGDNQFDFSTSKAKVKRDGQGFYQLGDLEIAIRSLDHYKQWAFYRTKDDQTLSTLPLNIHRKWQVEGDHVVFNVEIENPTADHYEIGGLGFAMIFNQIFTNNTLDESHTNSGFIDPYTGLDAGYLQVTRLNGQAPALLVLPQKGTQFEAYRPLLDDQTHRDVHFEGFYEWTVFSKAYYRTEWNSKRQWNDATSTVIAPNETRHFGLQFVGIQNPRDIPTTLLDKQLPTVDSLPGYVLHGDEDAKLYIHSKQPISSMTTFPEGVIDVEAEKSNAVYRINRSGDRHGQVRLTIRYEDGIRQTINYFATQSAKENVQRLADFHMTHQWVTKDDQFGRKHSFMTYDRDDDRQVLNEERSFISGDSDEAGAGPNLLMAMKNLLMPDAEQVKRLERYVDEVLWTHLQNDDYSIKASLYYSDQHGIYGWNKERSSETWRAYNYPHQATIYWVMYRLARNYDGLVTNHNWQWYLKQAYETVMAMHRFCGKDAFLSLEQYGLMVGSVHLLIFNDLQNEHWEAETNAFRNYMHFRYRIWAGLQYPYGSEMPWDSTGQEEVYTWCRYFGDEPKAEQTVQSIMAYTPAIPHWGYNGASRRYFDSFVYGKLYRISREFNHYASSLNAIPILDDYKKTHQNDLYQLKVGYAASTSPLTSIDQRGFASMAFLADPAVMDFDPYTSDYGQAFYGYVHDAGQYVYHDAKKGWLSFGGRLIDHGQQLTLTPEDAFQRRLFLHDDRLNFEIFSETTAIKQVNYDAEKRLVTIEFEASGQIVPHHLRLKTTDNLVPVDHAEKKRGAYQFTADSKVVQLKVV